MERYKTGLEPLGHLCLAVDNLINLALQTNVLTPEEFNVLHHAIWGVRLARDEKQTEATDAAS